jgi:hypothetical protein
MELDVSAPPWISLERRESQRSASEAEFLFRKRASIHGIKLSVGAIALQRWEPTIATSELRENVGARPQ